MSDAITDIERGEYFAKKPRRATHVTNRDRSMEDAIDREALIDIIRGALRTCTANGPWAEQIAGMVIAAGFERRVYNGLTAKEWYQRWAQVVLVTPNTRPMQATPEVVPPSAPPPSVPEGITAAQVRSDEEIALETATWLRAQAALTPGAVDREIMLARAAWLEEIADRAQRYHAALVAPEGIDDVEACARGMFAEGSPVEFWTIGCSEETRERFRSYVRGVIKALRERGWRPLARPCPHCGAAACQLLVMCAVRDTATKAGA